MRSSIRACQGIVILISTSWTSLALAVPINTLFGTGLDQTGSVLPGGSLDPHWQLVLSPDPAFPGPNLFVLNNSAPVIQSGGAPNSALSKWIGPRADGEHNFPRSDCTVGCTTAFYHFQTTFDLTGLDPNSAQIGGEWAMDDSATMLLNGALVATYPFVQGVNWRFFAPFQVTDGFASGINTLTVIVHNVYFPNSQLRDNPTGLTLQISGTAEVPEPTAILLLMCGCMGAGWRPFARRVSRRGF